MYTGWLMFYLCLFLGARARPTETVFWGRCGIQMHKKLMTLPFLPHRLISRMFLRPEVQARTEPQQNLVAYIRRQWIESTVFLAKNWSVYQQAITTNNDIEGWHNALNHRAGGQSGLSMYSLIELLEREARLTAVTIRLVSERKLRRVQRKQYRNLQAKLFDSWDRSSSDGACLSHTSPWSQPFPE